MGLLLIKQFDFKSSFLSSFIMNLHLAGFLHGMRVSIGPGWPGVWLRCFDHSIGRCWVHRSCAIPCFYPDTPVFCSNLQKWQLGFLVFFVSFHSEFTPAVHACSYLWSLIVSLYLLLKETFVQVPALQCCSRVPGSSLSWCYSSSITWGEQKFGFDLL